jgi:hypothetical protein
VTGLLLVILVFVGAVRLWNDTRNSVGVDFYQFWAVGRLLGQAGPVEIYTDDGRRKQGRELLDEARRSGSEYRTMAAEHRSALETYSTPFLYTVFRLGSSGSYERDLRLFRLGSMAGLILGILGLCRSSGHSWPAAAALVAAFIFWYEPTVSDLQVGNVNGIQLGVLALFLWLQHGVEWRRRDLLGGLLLGLATAFKPTTIFVVFLVLFSRAVNRRRRRLAEAGAGLALGGILALASSAMFFGSVRSWFDWLAAVRRLPDEIITVEMGNFAVARLLGDWTGAEAASFLMPLLTVLAAVPVWLARNKTGAEDDDPHRARFDDCSAVALGCLIMLLSLRLVWMHYYVLAAPGIVLLLAPVGESRWDTAALVGRCLLEHRDSVRLAASNDRLDEAGAVIRAGRCAYTLSEASSDDVLPTHADRQPDPRRRGRVVCRARSRGLAGRHAALDAARHGPAVHRGAAFRLADDRDRRWRAALPLRNRPGSQAFPVAEHRPGRARP